MCSSDLGIDRIPTLVRDGREGLLYSPAERDGLAGAIEKLTDVAQRARLGAGARARAVSEFSWAAHCRKLDGAIAARLDARRQRDESIARH